MTAKRELCVRFMKYVEKVADGCWIWRGRLDRGGYGRLSQYQDGKTTPLLAHRISWEIHNYKITPSQHVLHHCDNPSCVNPEHLFLGDQAANNRDMIAKGRFKPGHVFGEKHGCAKLTEKEVLAIRATTGSSIIVGKQFGVSGRQVRDIRLRNCWRHV